MRDRGRMPGPGPIKLPQSATSFVGRKAECAELSAVLGQSRLLVLTGAGGVGKTRLAMEVAGRCGGSYPGGVWWIDLAPLADAALVGDTMARVLGVRPLPGRTAAEAVADRLGGRRALIVLDNAEHVRDAAAEICAFLIRGCPRVTVMVTSREALGAIGESDWSVPPLTLPAARTDHVTAAMVWSSDAGRVFVERAGAVRSGFELTDDNAAAVSRVCHGLDGMPLAIELAAARVRMLSVEQISERLADRFRLLSTGPRGVAERQRTLRRSVDWSHDLLTQPERVLFRRLAVFADTWSLDAAETVCDGTGLRDTTIFDALDSLVGKSLVVAEERKGVMRYRFLETVRQYAIEMLVGSGEQPALQDRHLDYFLALAERASVELETPRNLAWLETLDPDSANMDAAIFNGVDRDPQKALRLAVALTMWWNMRGRFEAGQSFLERALSALPEVGPWHARALWSRGHLASYRGDFDVAGASFEQALGLAETLDDSGTRARALFSLAALGLPINPRAAGTLIRQAADLAREVHDEWAVMSALTTLAWSHLMTGEFTLAEDVFAEAAPAVRMTGLEGEAWTLLGMGWCAVAKGEYAAARSSFQAGLVAAQHLGDPVTEGFGGVLLARLELMQGRVDQALERAGAGEAAAVAAGAVMVLPSIRVELACALAAAGRCGDALEVLGPMVDSGLDQGWTLCEALLALTEITRASGDFVGALTHAEQALALSQRLGIRSLEASASDSLARLAMERGDWSGAGGLARRAMDHWVAAEVPDRLPQSFDQLARVAAALGSFGDAARLLGVADGRRRELGLAPPPLIATVFVSLEEELRRRLGADAFEAALAEGQRMPLAEAVSWVGRARGLRKRPVQGWASLTPTESQVVDLVARGMTNPQIAERMFISRATVKVHLSHVFGKLSVKTRSEVASMAARRDRPAGDRDSPSG